MMRWIIGSSLKARAVVIALAAGIAFVGIIQLRDAPRDVLPEFTEPSVEVQTEALGLSAQEVEQLVTVPLEQDLLNGTPFVDKIRSKSLPGLSSIVLVFKPGTDLARARQVVTERMTQAAGIPNVSKPPQMLQPLSSTSRVMLVGLSSRKLSLIDMGVLARWTIRPRLMGVHGVANVSIFGQRERQLQVQVDPKELAAEGVTLDDIIATTGNALWWSPLGRLEANTPGTGGFFDGPTQRLGIFHQSPIRTPDDLAKVALESSADTAAPSADTPRLGDVAEVVDDHQPLVGDGIVGNRPGLVLVIQKLPDANVVDVSRGVDRALDELAPGMAGIHIDRSLFRPASYVQRSTDHLVWAFVAGALLLALLLVALLFEWRSALIAAVAVLLSLLAAGLVLRARGETVNAMILAGLAVALVVLADDVIADTERVRRRLRERRTADGDSSTARVVLDASLESRRPLAYATIMVLVVLLPVAVLGGEVGAFLPSVALSYAIAVVVSMSVALTLTPVLAALLLANAPHERSDPPGVRWIRRAHERLLPRLLAAPRVGIAVFGVLVVAGAATMPFLDRGHSLVPPLRDTNVLVQLRAAPGTSLAEMDRVTTRAGRALRAIPGVRDVGAQVGRAVLDDQVVDVNTSELWVNVSPSASYGRTVDAIRSVVDGYPGLSHAVLTYPAERVEEVLHDGRRDLTVRIYGADADVLRAKAGEVRRAVSRISGVSAPTVALAPVEPTFAIEVDLAAAQRVGIKPGDVRRAAATLLSGLGVGALFEDQKVFDVVVWGTPETRANISSIRDLLIDTPSGGTVRLGDVADVRVTRAQTVIEHEDVSRFVDVGMDVRGRDAGAVAGDVRRRLRAISFPLEHHAVVLDDYSKHRSAFLRFLAVSIAAGVGVFLLLQAATRSWRLATLAFLVLPGALVGGLVAALADGGTLTIGSIAAFFVVFAIAARHVVVTLEECADLAERGGETRTNVVARVTRERAVPIVATTLGAIALLAPFLVLGHTAGYEIVHPMAVVALGGLVTAAIVNLVVVPAAYVLFAPTPEPHVVVDLTTETVATVDGNGAGEIATSSATGATGAAGVSDV